MITIRTDAEIHGDRRVVINLPPETPLGAAEIVVTVSPKANGSHSAGNIKRHFGAVNSGDAQAADNARIDEDLARSYENLND
jgi:hypothetical protein